MIHRGKFIQDAVGSALALAAIHLSDAAFSQTDHATLNSQGVKDQFIILDNASHDGPLYSTSGGEFQVLAFLNEVFSNSAIETTKSRNQ